MKPLERLTHRVIFRSGIIVVAATMVLALSSTSARHVGLDVLAATVIGVSSAPVAAAENNDTAIRPFRVNVPKADLADLRRRLAATRWPDKETVADQSQGAQLAKLQELVRYWGTDYDWRKAEAKLNAFPQFKTRIDGVDIHFIHVRSPHPNALPLIITHGWPGSVFEQIKLIGPLTDPDQVRRPGRGCLRRRDSVPARLRLFGATDRGGLGTGAHRQCVGRPHEAAGVHALRRAGRRLGGGCRRGDGPAGASGPARHPHQLPGGDHRRSRSGARRRQVRAGSVVREGTLCSQGPRSVRREWGPLLSRR